MSNYQCVCFLQDVRYLLISFQNIWLKMSSAVHVWLISQLLVVNLIVMLCLKPKCPDWKLMCRAFVLSTIRPSKNTELLPSSCFSVHGVLTFSDEIAYAVVTYTCRTCFIGMWPKFQMCERLINIVLFCEFAHRKWMVVEIEWSTMMCRSKWWTS